MGAIYQPVWKDFNIDNSSRPTGTYWLSSSPRKRKVNESFVIGPEGEIHVNVLQKTPSTMEKALNN